MIQVAIVDSHKVLTDTLQLVLHWEAGFELVGAASDIKSAQHLIGDTRPDVLLLEVNLPDGNGLDLIPLINEKSPRTKIIILTSSVDDELVLGAIEQNVHGLLSKECSFDELLRSIRAAAEGDLAIPKRLLVEVLRRQTTRKSFVRENDYIWEKLTDREMDVLNCLVHGQSSSVIANQLHIAPMTVRTHIRNLMSKLGAHSRLEAVSFALSRGIIQAPQ